LGRENISKPTIENGKLRDYYSDCDTGHCLVAAKVRERWTINKKIGTELLCGEIKSQETK
jgi:hypothetical protein